MSNEALVEAVARALYEHRRAPSEFTWEELVADPEGRLTASYYYREPAEKAVAAVESIVRADERERCASYVESIRGRYPGAAYADLLRNYMS